MEQQHNITITLGIQLQYILDTVNPEEKLYRQAAQSAIDYHIGLFMSEKENVDKLISLVFGDDIKLVRCDTDEKEDK